MAELIHYVKLFCYKTIHNDVIDIDLRLIIN